MSKKPTYTLEIHIQRLKKILEVPVLLPCWHCPAQEHIGFNVCGICRDFVNVPRHQPGCPCIVLGDEEATKRT